VNQPAAEPAQLAGECAAILEKATEGAGIRRLGLVIQRYVEVDQPSLALITRFCSPPTYEPRSDAAPFRNSTGFQIHNLKQYRSPLEYDINSWVRCKTTAVRSTQAPAVTIEQDINTLPKVEHSFSGDAIERFAQMAVDEARQILSLYFPPSETS
jgi:hypothetical protein